MGLLDYLGGNGGLLPFDQQWMLANGGQFGAQSQPGTTGYGAFPGYQPITPGAPGYNAQPPAQDAFASAPGGVPMPPQRPADLGGGGILPGGPQPPQPQMPLWMQSAGQGTPPGIQPVQAPQATQGGLAGMLGGLFGVGNAQAQSAPGGAPASPGIGDRLSAGLMGFANAGGGALPALSNLISGLATGQRSDPRGMMMEQQAAIEKALVGAGVPPNVARAASLNQEVLKTVAPLIYNKPTWGVIGHDIANNPQYGWIDTTHQTITAPKGGGTGYPVDASGSPLQGPELLAHLEKTDPASAAEVKAIIRGDASVTGRNLQKYQPIANLVDPTLQQFNYDTRKKTALDFAAGGKSANNVKSLETVGGHIDKMVTAFDKLGNTWQPEFNSVKNWFAVRGGQGGVNAFETFANGVANELGTVFRSFGMSDAEVKSWRDRIASSSSPDAFNDGMSALVDMLKTRKEALIEQYRNGLGKEPPPTMFAKLDAAIEKIGERSKLPGPDQTTAPSEPPPVAGAKQAADGNWYVPDPKRPGKFLMVKK